MTLSPIDSVTGTLLLLTHSEFKFRANLLGFDMYASVAGSIELSVII